MKPDALIEAYFASIRGGSASLSYDPHHSRWSVILAAGKHVVERSSPRLTEAIVNATVAMDAELHRPVIHPPPPKPPRASD
ncbi:MAG TPA: hypothetical protein VLH09_06770 [Bryobacteraceae bacterium]|nr:hypothetical protein [Bryobacteraceae bacterium]